MEFLNLFNGIKIIMKYFKISIIGLGYVGLPLAIEFGKKFQTIGFDLSKKRIEELINKVDSNSEIKKKQFLDSKYSKFSNNASDILGSNIFIVTVPTPVDKKNKPDVKNIISASKLVARSLIKNKKPIVVFESTVYPGLTEEVCLPILLKYSGLKWKKDFNIGYSPERINPGDKNNSLINIKKLVAGDTKTTLSKLASIYGSIIKAGVFEVPSIKIAEAAKVIENAQRDINIAFMNELSLIFKKMQIPTYEVLKAANTKWNFLDFKPGLVGGHCIGVDPYYLSYKSKSLKYSPKIIEAGREINDSMHLKVVDEVNHFLKKKFTKNILFIGLSFKANTNDLRNSKNIEIVKSLKKLGYKKIDIFDPILNHEDLEQDLKNSYKKLLDIRYDTIIIGSFHKILDKKKIKIKIFNSLKKNSLLFDINNSLYDFLKKFQSKKTYIYKSL